MAPKAKTKAKKPTSSDPQGMFKGMIVFLVGIGVQTRRLEVLSNTHQSFLQINLSFFTFRGSALICLILALNAQFKETPIKYDCVERLLSYWNFPSALKIKLEAEPLVWAVRSNRVRSNRAVMFIIMKAK